MVRTLTLKTVQKTGTLVFKLPGVPGAVYVEGKMLEPGSTPPQTLDIDVPGMREPGADASEAARLKTEKAAERDAAKAVKAEASIAKSQARLEKLQASAQKAADKAAAVAAKFASATAPVEAAPAEE